MLKKPLVLLAIFSLTLNLTSEANAVVKAGAACPKVGIKKTEGVNLYICTKVGKSNVWTKQANSVPTTKPSTSLSPTPSTSPTKSIEVLGINPIITLEQGTGKSNGLMYANIFLELAPGTNTQGLGLFVEGFIASGPSCRSGNEYIPKDIEDELRGVGRTIRESRDPTMSLSQSLVFALTVPSIPINIRCPLKMAPQYRFWVYQTSNIGGTTKVAVSQTTTISNPYFVPPTPTPTPTPSYSSQPTITAGQPCAPEGSSVIAADGNRYTCKKSLSDSNLYWNK